MGSVTRLAGGIRRLLASLLLFAVVANAGAQPAPGFSPLFDGTLANATIENRGAFTIEDRVLRAEGPEGAIRYSF